MFLGDIFQVKSGLVVSRKKANDESLAKFNYKQLNLRAINKNGYLEMSELEVLLTESAVSSEYLTAFGEPTEQILLLKNGIQIHPSNIIEINPINYWV